MTRVPAGHAGGPLAVVLALGTAQTVAWASSSYLPAILAAPIARDLDLAPERGAPAPRSTWLLGARATWSNSGLGVYS